MEQVLVPKEVRTDRRHRSGSGGRGREERGAAADADVRVVRPGPLVSERDVERMRSAVTSALHDGAREVVVDLSGVRSITVDAIGVLLVLHAEAGRYGRRVRVDNAGHAVRRKLRITGALGHLS